MRVRDREREAEFFSKNYPPDPIVLQDGKESAKNRLWRFLRANPKLVIQIALVLFVLASEKFKLERKMTDAGQAIEKLRGVADILTGTLASVRAAAEAPAKIGQVLNL